VSVEVSCPACGATISFKIGSSVAVVCEYCNSVIARGDRAFEDLGKIADVVETGSPLDLGLKGVYQGVPFELTGRAQLGHQAGGVWDEWYAAFQDGRWGWLAEAQGKFYLTFEQQLPEQALIPPFEALRLGEPVAALSTSVPLMVGETGEAEALGAKGEIPYRLVPGSKYLYADLSGPRGVFATIDYSDEAPTVYLGREVSFTELGFPPDVQAPEREARRVEGLQLSCPKCGGPLELRAPDSSRRVTCPNCGSLLDISQGKLQFLQALDPRVKPIIPLGTAGQFQQGQFTVIGFVVRSVEFEGVRYYWEEYLLYNPQIGFRWLVRSDDNWNFVEPVPLGDVETTANPRNIRYKGDSYKLYQDTPARVEHVAGEFYWEVTAGETVRAADYIHPPYMLSREASLSGPVNNENMSGEGNQKRGKRRRRQPSVETGEVIWSLGTFMRPGEVEKALGISGLPRTSKIAPNQPFLHKRVYKYWAWLLLLSFFVGIGVMATGPRRQIYETTYPLEPLKSAEDSQVKFTEPFELKAHQNVRVTAKAPVDNTWLEVQGDLIDATTNDSVGFSLPVEYYHGVDGGESWSEGTNSPSTYLSAPPAAGQYMLGLEVRWERWQQPTSLTVRVEQGVPHFSYLIATMAVISIFPILVAFYHLSFEKRRWADSDYSPYESN
jgi:DNA-directed RNA polymerase subunit RPC12/RpoP